VLGAVNGGLGEIETDDLVVGAEGLVDQLVEHPDRFPLVPAGPQGGVGDCPSDQSLGVDPRAPCDQADEHGLEADPIGDPRSMTAQGVGPVRGREQGLDRCPHCIKHFGLECAHDIGDLHLVVGLERTQNQIWAITTTGGWSPIRAAS